MSRYPRRDLSPVLKMHSVEEARADLLELDQQLDLIPATSRESLLTAIDQIVEFCLEHSDPLTNLAAIVDNQTTVIAATSGIRAQRHHQFLSADDAHQLHLYRNLLLVLVLAAVSSYNGDAAPIAARFKQLPQRTAADLRPYADDETLLLRVWALHLSRGDKNNRRAAAVYGECDAGLIAGETTSVNTDDLALSPDGSLIAAPGHDSGVKSRVIELDKFAVTVLDRYLAGADLADGDLLTYRPRKADSYAAAAVSAIGVIDRIRKAVGLKQHDTTNASVWMWRATMTRDLHGVKAAVTISGRSSIENLNEILRNAKNPIKDHKRNKGKPRTFGID
jgi:hypothetical protein